MPPTTFSTGYITGPTGTFCSFPFTTTGDLYLTAHPMNSGTVYVISNPGSIGFPIKAGKDPLVLTNVTDLSSLRGWVEVANDKICYLIVSR